MADGTAFYRRSQLSRMDWDDLFERAGEHQTTVEAVRETLARRRRESEDD